MAATMTEKERKAYDKAMDLNDDTFCGFMALQTLDEDGYQKKTKGSSVEAPVHIEHVGNTVKITGYFTTPNPLFYLEIQNSDTQFVFGHVWFGGDKVSRTNEIGKIVPKSMALLDAERSDEKTKGVAKAELQLAYIRDSTTRLCAVELNTVEKKFKTTLTKAVMTIPKDAWLELKAYRLKFWQQNKSWEAFKKGDDEDEKKKTEEE
eukprot:GEMP01082660.1.p1 GENE.GEMP01082660.1~~GEMP01082660.1.p1  ORF type:complete len:206 (+),score=47.08 GEMP01082660.1:44-661(+)